MSVDILFYFVFLSQVILISYYYPRQIVRQMNYVHKTYPQSEYPKLYPKNIAYHETGWRIYRLINHLIFAFGLIIILFIGLWENPSNGKISSSIPVIYFMIQIIPLVLIELSSFAYFKLMRKTDVRTTRKADLLPRRLFDFVSPKLVGLAAFMNIACLFFFYNLHQFSFHLSNDTFVVFITLTMSNLIFAGIIFRNLYGSKLDPHQAGKDRIKQIEFTSQALVLMSIAASVFLITVEAVSELHLDFLEPVLMSLYLQLIVFIALGHMLRTLRVENMDFDVYKKDAPAL